MLRHAFDFIEKDWKILNQLQTNSFPFDNIMSSIFYLTLFTEFISMTTHARIREAEN